MRYIITIFWTFLLTQLLTYVVTAMTNTPYDFKVGVFLGIALCAIIFLIPTVLPDDPTEDPN